MVTQIRRNKDQCNPGTKKAAAGLRQLWLHSYSRATTFDCQSRKGACQREPEGLLSFSSPLLRAARRRSCGQGDEAPIRRYGVPLSWGLPASVGSSTASRRAIGLTASQVLPDLDEPTLADLIDNLAVTKAAAEAACTALSECEEKYRDADGNLASVATPRVRSDLRAGLERISPQSPRSVPENPHCLACSGGLRCLYPAKNVSREFPVINIA